MSVSRRVVETDGCFYSRKINECLRTIKRCENRIELYKELIRKERLE